MKLNLNKVKEIKKDKIKHLYSRKYLRAKQKYVDTNHTRKKRDLNISRSSTTEGQLNSV